MPKKKKKMLATPSTLEAPGRRKPCALLSEGPVHRVKGGQHSEARREAAPQAGDPECLSQGS